MERHLRLFAAINIFSLVILGFGCKNSELNGQVFDSDLVTPKPPTISFSGVQPIDSVGSPSFALTGLTPGHTIELYTDSSCGVGSLIASYTATSTSQTITLPNNLSPGQYTFHILAKNGTYRSPCSKNSLNYTYDSESPSEPSGLSVPRTSATITESPIITWTPGTDTLTGVFYYEAAIFDASDDSLVADYRTLQSGQNIQGLNLTPTKRYYYKLRSVDQAGNKSLEVQSSNWFAPIEGYIFLAMSSMGPSDYPNYDPSNSSMDNYDLKFAQTLSMGIFERTHGSNTTISPTGTISYFNPDDVLGIYATEGSWEPDHAEMILDFLDSNGDIVFWIQVYSWNSFGNRQRYGTDPTRAVYFEAGSTNNYPKVVGDYTFDAENGIVTYTNTRMTGGWGNSWSIGNVDVAAITQMRVTSSNIAESYSGQSAAYITLSLNRSTW